MRTRGQPSKSVQPSPEAEAAPNAGHGDSNIRRGILWLGLEATTRRILELAIFAILGRLLGPEVFGLYAMAVIVLTFGELCATGSFGQSLIQKKELTAGHIDSAFFGLIALGLLLTLAIAALSGPFAALFGDSRVESLLLYGSPVVVISAISATPIALLRREMRYVALVVVPLSGVIVGGIVGVAAALAGYGPHSLIFQILASQITLAISAWIASRWRPRGTGSLSKLRELSGFGLKTMALQVILFLNNSLPRYMAGTVIGPAALGLYTAAARFRDTARSIIVAPIADVAMPAAAKDQDDRKGLAEMVVQASGWTALMAFPGFVGLAIVSPELLTVLLGQVWRDAAPAAQLLAMAGIATSVTSVNLAAIHGAGYAGWRLGLALIQITLTLGLLLSLAHKGMAYVALSVAVTTLVLWPVKVLVTKFLIDVSVKAQLASILRPVIATAIMAAVTILWRSTIAGELGTGGVLVTSIAVGVVSYGLAIWLIAPQEMRSVLRMVSDKLMQTRPPKRRRTAPTR